MIPLLSDLAGASSLLLASGGTMPQAPALDGAGLDFAGLLGAALPESGAAGEPAVPAPPTAPNSPLALPTGKNVPEPGAPLPPLSLPTPPPVIRAVAVRAPSPGQAPDEALPVSKAPAIVSESEPVMSAEIALPSADAALQEPFAPDPALVAVLPPVPAIPPTAAPPQRDMSLARGKRAVVAPAARAENARSPARGTLPRTPVAEALPLPPAHAANPSRDPAALLPAPEASVLPAPAPAQPVAAPPMTLTTPAPDRIDAPRALPPQLESAIAQVGDLREALRSARPEMTLRHGEFGVVALRLEQSGAQDWRAVLASRDPGFVPAIQAALAERAVAAASASADSGQSFGQPGAGQNGPSDQRYGASPNGAQGGSQPYLGHSAHRDGEAAPDHRHPSTAAALAARAEEGEEASGSSAGSTRGMFA